MAGKSKDYKPEFTYEKLGEILKDSTQKAKTGKLDLEGSCMACEFHMWI